MTGQALGLIEAVGLPAALAAADAAAKAANVRLLGYELTKGGGLVTVKLEGDVAAVKAAVDAGAAEAERVNRVWATHVIPRPAPYTGQMVALGNGRQAAQESVQPENNAAAQAAPSAPSTANETVEETLKAENDKEAEAAGEPRAVEHAGPAEAGVKTKPDTVQKAAAGMLLEKKSRKNMDRQGQKNI